MADTLNISKIEQGDTIILKLKGRLDTMTASSMETLVKDLNEPIAKLVIDCDDLDYISSAGLRVFLQTRKRFGENVMRLEKVHSSIYEILEVTGFNDFFDVEVVEDKENEEQVEDK